MLPKLDEMKVLAGSTLREAMANLERTAQGICFIVTADGKLLGSLSDGDIRRYLLHKGSISDPAERAANLSPMSLPAGASLAETQRAISDRIKVVPIVDPQGRIVDYASARRLHQVPILEPVLGGNELEYVTDCIRSGWISSKGAYVARFERSVADYVGMPYAVAVCNGTTALHLALLAAGVGPGDEVIVPNFTFAASANAVIHAGATPVLVDIVPGTWTISPSLMARAITPRTRAVMPVHIYGHPCHMDEIAEIARKHGLAIVEDCAESLGSVYHGRRVGYHGDAAAFSFFGNKVITTGEGGMILFNDKARYERARLLRDHGMSPQRRYWHECVGYNYRMTNLQAAIGVAQMEQIDHFLARRAQVAERYSSRLAQLPYFTLQTIEPWAKSNNWLYTVLIEPTSPLTRDELLEKLLRNGIETRPAFCALDAMPPYRDFNQGQSMPVSHDLMRRGLSLPSSVTLSGAEIDHVIDRILDLMSFEDLKRSSRFATGN